MATLNINEVCFDLSERVAALGVGINSKRAAQESFSILTQACADIGGGVRAINCLPARSMRIRQTEELIKLTTKVIFLLEAGLRQKLFLVKPARLALSAAIALSNGLGAFVSEYCTKPVPVTMPVNITLPADYSLPEFDAVQFEEDPEGFATLYTDEV